MASPTSNANGAGNDRLNGWKEIALHFGKGVRTVQRWEKDLGLPVRRLGTGKGEIVFAFVAELEGWRAAAEKREDLATKPGEEDPPDGRETRSAASTATDRSASPPTAATRNSVPAVATAAPAGRRRLRARTLLLTIPAIALLAIAAWWGFRPRPRQPYEARVENHALRVYDQDGRFLWEHRFEFPLADGPEYTIERANRPSVLVEDLDGEGERGEKEVVFATNQEPMDVPGGLFVFEANGDLRFRHQPRPRRVSFGGIPSPGPWHPLSIASAPDAAGGRALWLASNDRDQFQTVVEKLDARGGLLGEFWHPGNVTAMAPAERQGKAVMLLGASSNEYHGAALAVVDRSNPTGTGPALRPKFTCSGCPPQPPLDYLVFPGTDVERLQENNAGVLRVRVAPGGEVTVVVNHALHLAHFGRGRAVIVGHTHYILGTDLGPLSAQHQPDYRALHNEAHRLGILDHPFSTADDHALWPMLRWDGTRFEELRAAVRR